MYNMLRILIVLMLATSITQAQTDKKAQEILKSVSAKYRSFKSIAAKFSVKVSDKANKTVQNQTGSIKLKGTKYHVLLGEQEIISDGKVVWNFLKEANEVQINDQKSDENSITPQNIFTIYEKGFKSRFVEEKMVAGKNFQIIELIPEDAKRNFIKIQLTINKTEKYIAQAVIFEKSGTNLMYKVESFTPNVAIDDAIFTFNKSAYPKAEVIDLRN